jgi:hypothetical protein
LHIPGAGVDDASHVVPLNPFLRPQPWYYEDGLAPHSQYILIYIKNISSTYIIFHTLAVSLS